MERDFRKLSNSLEKIDIAGFYAAYKFVLAIKIPITASFLISYKTFLTVFMYMAVENLL